MPGFSYGFLQLQSTYVFTLTLIQFCFVAHSNANVFGRSYCRVFTFVVADFRRGNWVLFVKKFGNNKSLQLDDWVLNVFDIGNWTTKVIPNILCLLHCGRSLSLIICHVTDFTTYFDDVTKLHVVAMVTTMLQRCGDNTIMFVVNDYILCFPIVVKW